MYSTASSHRETILLIDPMDVRARCDLLEELWTVYRKYYVSPAAKEMFGHIDFLIRNKLVSFWQAHYLCTLMLYENQYVADLWKQNAILSKLSPEEHIYYDAHLGLLHFAPMIYQLPLTLENMDPGDSLILNWGKYDKDHSREESLRLCIPIYYSYILGCQIPEHAKSIEEDFLKFLLSTPENCYYEPFIRNDFRIYQGTGGNWCLDLKNRDPIKWRNLKDQLLGSGRDDLTFLVKYFEINETIDHDNAASEQTPQAIQNAMDFAEERGLYAKVPWMKDSLANLKTGYEEQLASLAGKRRDYEETVKTSVRSDYLLKMPFLLPIEDKFHLDMKMSVELIPDWREAFGFPSTFSTISAYSKQNNSARNDANILIPEPHNSKADLAWNHWAIFFWRNVAGEVEQKPFYRFEIPEKYTKFKSETDILIENYQAGNGIIRVRSDGKNIWAATTEGILCFDATGKILGRFDTTTGLPDFVTPYRELGNKDIGTMANFEHHTDAFEHETVSATRSLQYKDRQDGSPIREYVILSVVPIGNAQAIAVGRSGGNMKTWVAKLSFNSAQKPQVKVLHQAARDLTREEEQKLHQAPSAFPEVEKAKTDLLNDPKNIDVAFAVPWITEMIDPLFPKRRQFLIGRTFGGIGLIADIPLSPLLIDLDSEEVMLVTKRYPDLEGLAGFENVKCVNGHLIGTRRRIVYSFDRKGDNVYVKTDLGLRAPYTESWDEQPQRSQLIVDGNQVYSPGLAWYKIDFSESHGKPTIKKLADEIMPYERFFDCYTKTASYGICGLYFCCPFNACCAKCGQLYQFDFSTPTSRDYSHSERFVVDYWLDNHDEAARHLQEKGAIIGGMISDWLKKHEPGSLHDMLRGDRHTVVVLDKTWKGTAADLETIEKLYRPWTLYVYDLKLGDDDVKALAGLLTKFRTRYLYFVNAGISEEQLKLLDASHIHTLGLYFDQPEIKPTDEWLSILYEPAKHGVKTDPFYGELKCNDGLFSPEATNLLKERK